MQRPHISPEVSWSGLIDIRVSKAELSAGKSNFNSLASPRDASVKI
jgi:hypothetical protein